MSKLSLFSQNLGILDNAAVRDYLEASLSDNTRRAYREDLRHFQAWGGIFPATPEQIACYLLIMPKNMLLRH